MILSLAWLIAAPKKVCINKIVEHPALNATTQGIIDTLKDHDIEMRVESAQGNPSLAMQITNKFVNQKAEIIVGIGTVVSQTVRPYAMKNKTTLVFSTVTDPIGAELVNDLQKPNGNTTGVSNFVPLEPQLLLFKKIKPSLKKIGFLYNPGESNSISLVKKLEKLCPKMGLVLVKQAAFKSSEMPFAAAKLALQVDAIFISNDSTALSALSGVIREADKAEIPVFVSDVDAVKLGAVAALGPNQYKIGVQTGKMILRILSGQNPATIPVEFPQETELYLNVKAVQNLGLIVPEDLVKIAKQIVS